MYTCKLDVELGRKLFRLLQERNWEFYEVAYARFAAKKEKTNVVYYESGKFVSQGKGTQEFVEFILEPEVLGQASVGYETFKEYQWCVYHRNSYGWQIYGKAAATRSIRRGLENGCFLFPFAAVYIPVSVLWRYYTYDYNRWLP